MQAVTPKLKRVGLWLFAVLLACTIPSAAQKVKVGYDKSANLSKYHTYGWAKPQMPATRPIFYDYVVNTIDGQLRARGLKRVEQGCGPDANPCGQDRVWKQFACWNSNPSNLWWAASGHERHYVDWRKSFVNQQRADRCAGKFDSGICGSKPERSDLEWKGHPKARFYTKAESAQSCGKGNREAE